MITLNNKKLARNDEEFIDSLFKAGGTCVGYYRPNKVSITILDHNKVKVGVINKHGVLCKATKQSTGKYWYSFGDIDIIGKGASYSAMQDDIQAALLKDVYKVK